MAIAEGGPEVDMPALPELAQFVVPLIQGSVHQISDLQLVTSHADYSGSLTLVARRSSQRPGVRHWRRGAAPDVSAPFGITTSLSLSLLLLGPSMTVLGSQAKCLQALMSLQMLSSPTSSC